jgi:8-oxo-dGTP pyrophosphatase MutT (NUDIX family)
VTDAGAPDLSDRPFSWPVVSSQDLHRDAWVVSLREDLVQRPGHPDDTHRRLVLEHPGAAIVLAVDDEERVCLIRQYRHAAQGLLVELPAGILDKKGEDPAVTAARELREEVQLQATDWRLMAVLNPSAGISTELHHIYLARGLSFADRGDFEMTGEEADLEVFWAPFDDVLEAVLSRQIQESPFVVAVLTYDALRRRGEL